MINPIDRLRALVTAHPVTAYELPERDNWAACCELALIAARPGSDPAYFIRQALSARPAPPAEIAAELHAILSALGSPS